MTTSIEIPEYVATTASYRHGDLLVVELGEGHGTMVIGTHDQQAAATAIDLFELHFNTPEWAPGPTNPSDLNPVWIVLRAAAPDEPDLAWAFDEVPPDTPGSLPAAIYWH